MSFLHSPKSGWLFFQIHGWTLKSDGCDSLFFKRNTGRGDQTGTIFAALKEMQHAVHWSFTDATRSCVSLSVCWPVVCLFGEESLMLYCKICSPDGTDDIMFECINAPAGNHTTSLPNVCFVLHVLHSAYVRKQWTQSNQDKVQTLALNWHCYAFYCYWRWDCTLYS